MQVEGCLEAHFVKLAQETFRVREELAVPAVAGPAAPLAEVVVTETLLHILVGIMPVHIHYHNVHRDAPGTHFAAKVQHFGVGVDPVSAPPVTKGIAGRQRYLPCHGGKVFQRGGIVVPVGKEIPVQPVAFIAGGHPAVFRKQMPGRFVHQRPAVAGQDAVFQLLIAVRQLLETKAAVQGTDGPLEVAVRGHPRLPSAQGMLYAKVFGRKAASPVNEGKFCRLYGEHPAAFGFAELGDGKIPVHYGQRGAVLENPVGRPFHPDEPVGEDGETSVSGYDCGFRTGCRACIQADACRQGKEDCCFLH